MSTSGTVRGVVISSVPATAGREDEPTTFVKPTVHGSMPTYSKMTINADELNDGSWTDSDVTRRLGIALKFKQIPSPDDDPGANTYSRRLNAITANMDPESDDFGKYSTAPIRGKLLVVRADRVNMHPNFVELILEYLHRYINIDSKPCAERRKKLTYIFDQHMFKLYWDSFVNMAASRARDEATKQTWLTMQCPVSEKPVCKTCGQAGTEEKPLLKCAACKQVCYCTKECQKADWKVHKFPCKMQQLTSTFGAMIRT